MADEYLKNVKFLIVDDNAFMRAIIRQALAALHADQVREAADGEEALRLMETYVPDIVILDWEMKPMDGLEFTVRVRLSKDSPNVFTPIIMVSGHFERRRVVAARNAGVNEFVVQADLRQVPVRPHRGGHREASPLRQVEEVFRSRPAAQEGRAWRGRAPGGDVGDGAAARSGHDAERGERAFQS